MNPVPRLSLHELTAAHLREGLQKGRWNGNLPGAARLSRELDVAPATIRAAFRLLESEGLLTARGLGRSRVISANIPGILRPPMRVAILRHDARPTDNALTSAVLIEIIHSLEVAGHTAFFCKESQMELRHDVRPIAKTLAKARADAWIIEAGSHELLEWCSKQDVPCLALYGRTSGLALAHTGPDKAPAYREAVRSLLALGHRRIVLIVRAQRRVPAPGKSERAFLEELAASGVVPNEYNLPNWDETPAGFYELLERLFRHSPPTALIVDEVARYVAAAEFLARRGIQVPEQVSLVSTDDDPTFAWCHHGIAHIRWDNKPIERHVLRWVKTVRKGNADKKSITFPTKFMPGGSIGPVSKSGTP